MNGSALAKPSRLVPRDYSRRARGTPRRRGQDFEKEPKEVLEGERSGEEVPGRRGGSAVGVAGVRGQADEAGCRQRGFSRARRKADEIYANFSLVEQRRAGSGIQRGFSSPLRGWAIRLKIPVRLKWLLTLTYISMLLYFSFVIL